MYEELVKRLRNRRLCIQQSGSLENYPLLKEAADAIEELSREYESIATSLNESVELVRKLQQPRWIPVTERLPENGRYLAVCESYIKDGDPYVRLLGFAKSLESVNYDFDGINRCGWYDYDCEVGYYEVDTVTHWMPLPEPPKEDGTDEGWASRQ